MTKPGQEIKPVTKNVTQEMINKWAGVSGDFNLLHIDPEFTKKTRYGGTIAHGHISISFICEMLTRQFGKNWVSEGKLKEVRFTAPVRPGYTVTAKGVVLEIFETNHKMLCDIWLENQDGERCVVGKAELPL